MIGLTSYDNGQKNTWRGWQWNRIVERLPEMRDSPWLLSSTSGARDVCASKTVLYLCGPEDGDRAHLHRRGFKDENIIAVDVDEQNVATVRQRGRGLAICAPLEDVIANWPSDWHLDVISADLCCGLTDRANRLAIAMFASRGVDHDTVIAVNLQRGRDSASNDFRAAVMENYRALPQSPTISDKHRAQMWWYHCLDLWHKSHGPHIARSYGEAFTPDAIPNWITPFIANHCCKVSDSYCASKVVMDSVVFRWLPVLVPEHASDAYRYQLAQHLKTGAATIYREGWPTPEAKVSQVKAKLAALRAVRTMKLKREGVRSC